MTTPKIFISTMFCGEGDFDQCVSAIENQKDVEITHQVIKDQPEFEAHRIQITGWNDRMNDFDLFVKVDSDTVLVDDHLIIDVFNELKAHDASAAQIRLHDYFTNSLINGLNFYTKESVFSVPQDRVYCDRSVVHKKFLHSDHGYFKRHVPAGLHAFFATERQAFHFGVHRGVKNRFDEQMLVENAYKREPTILRKLAIMGFESASLFKDNHQFNYGDALFNNVFESTMQRI